MLKLRWNWTLIATCRWRAGATPTTWNSTSQTVVCTPLWLICLDLYFYGSDGSNFQSNVSPLLLKIKEYSGAPLWIQIMRWDDKTSIRRVCVVGSSHEYSDEEPEGRMCLCIKIYWEFDAELHRRGMLVLFLASVRSRFLQPFRSSLLLQRDSIYVTRHISFLFLLAWRFPWFPSYCRSKICSKG